MATFDGDEPEKLGQDSGAEETEKKRYEKPSFRSGKVFVTQALSCGKTSTEFQCHHNNKNS